MLYRFQDFALLENVTDAKKWLERNKIDLNDPDFLEIKKLLTSKPNLTLLFTKLHFRDKVDLEELENLYNQITLNQNILNRLPKNITAYDNYEELSDNLRDLNSSQSLKKFENELPNNLSTQLVNLSEKEKDNLKNVTREFFELKKETRKLFTDKISRYNNITDVITALSKFVSNSQNAFNYSEILNILQNTSAIKVRFADEEKDIIVAQFYSFEAMGKLCSSTSWCIKDSRYQWENYVGGKNVFNTQYVVFNFNLPYIDNYSMIGITVKPDGTIRTAHRKDDGYVKDEELFNYFKEYGIPKKVLAPITEKEKTKRKNT